MVRIVLLFCLLGTSYAAIHREAFAVKKKISVEDKKLLRLNGKISKIELHLQKENKKFVGVVAKRNQIEVMIERLRLEIQDEKSELDKDKEKAERVIRGIILSRIGGDKTSVELLSDELMGKILKKNISTINSRLKENRALHYRLENLEKKHQQYLSSENDILAKLHNLEQDKQKIAHQYVNTIEQKETLERQLKKKEKIIANLNRRKRKGRSFDHPIGKYLSIDAKEQDLKYVFKGVQPVTAPRAGKVFKVTKFWKYWEAGVIIQHSGKYNTIIYGSFTPKVHDGDYVQKGEILGYTNVLSKTSGELFFGIRKVNKVLRAANYVGLKKKATI